MTTIVAPISLSAMPTVGQLLGTAGTQFVIDSINNSMNMGHEFFGSVHDMFQKGRSAFIQSTIAPIRALTHKISHAANKLLKNDVIMPLIEPKDFQYVPPSMHMVVLMHDPVRRLFQQGRVDGFGYDADFLPTEDVWGRLINNGNVPDVMKAMDANGDVDVTYEWWSDDPDVTFEEIDYAESTRNAIDSMLQQTSYDPTCYPNTRS